jgi:diguanylate cyclase (GGDEF)-like protein/PAS domain S-box-containing protein
VTQRRGHTERGRLGPRAALSSLPAARRPRLPAQPASEQHAYQGLVERIPLVTYMQTPGATSTTFYMSPQVEVLTGYPPERFLRDGTLWTSITHPDDRTPLLMEVQRTDATGDQFHVEQRIQHRDGTLRWVRNEAVLTHHPDGTPHQWQGYLLDITDRKQAEEQYRALVETIPVASYTYLVTDHAVTQYMSPQIERVTGYPPAAWLGPQDFWWSVIHPDDRAHVMAEAARTDLSGEPYRVEHRFVTKAGEVIWVRNEAIKVGVDQDGAERWQGVLSDITERKALEARLEHQALHDTLTGLPNRALLHDRIQQALAGAKRARKRIAVCFLDLDNFKFVNDSLGHAAGDALLCEVAERLRCSVRAGDTVARLGGDEFALVLQVDPDGALVAERVTSILGALRAPFDVGSRTIVVTPSLGVAVSRTRGEQPADLLRHADIAMYRAKGEGKDRFAIFESAMHTEAQQRLDAEHDLRRAVEAGQFALHYQPVIALDTGQAIGLEALLRWQHPERGLIAPNEFIPLAEETGLIIPLGAWALRCACRAARQWNDTRAAQTPLVVSVNVSGRQFREPNLVIDVQNALDLAGVPGELLRLEITESVAMGDAQATIATLRALRALGVSISIDDFGTGYSSLAYLRRFPVHSLKIDRSFIDALADDGDVAIVEAIIQLAQALDINVVAEGVETAAQLTQLRELGCNRAQGFHFARPLPPEQVLPWLSAWADAEHGKCVLPAAADRARAHGTALALQ